MNLPLISFVIVTYNSDDTIVPCLTSICSQTRCTFEIAVVDNSPSAGTLAAVERFQHEHPEISLHIEKPNENIGFGRGCNAGVLATKGEYIFFLNPDTEVQNDAASELVECIRKHPDAIMAGPAIRDADGRIAKTCRNLPTLLRIALDATGLDQWIGAYRLTRFGHDVPRVVEQIIGAAMLMRRSDFESMGGMDEQFFIYFEEVDLCNRMRRQGGTIWFWPKAMVQHLAGRSCETDSVRARMIYVLRESRRKYFAKHFGTWGAVAMDVMNRLEAVEKMLVFSVLWLATRQQKYLEKLAGFRAVVLGNPSGL